MICLVTVITTFIIFRRFSKSVCGSSLPCLESKDQRTGYYPYLSSSTTTTTLTPPTPGQEQDPSQYCLRNECQVLRPLMITPIGPNSTIYRATFANGQQAHVIPINQQQTANKNFRPITPSASHIYMEIDPVYNSETLSDILVSDLSDDDLRKSSEEGGRRVDDLPKFKYHSLHYPSNHPSNPLPSHLSNHPPNQPGNHAGDVSCISNHCERRGPGDRSGDFNGVDLPISATYTGAGQQLLRLDLKGAHEANNFGQFNQFGQQQPGPVVQHTWQRQQQNHNHVFQ